MEIKPLFAGFLCLVAAVAHSAPVPPPHAAPQKKYSAILLEAKVVPSPIWEQDIEFEVVMEVDVPEGEKKTLRLSGEDGMRIELVPGDRYSVAEYRGGSASLDYFSFAEQQKQFSRPKKKKAKR